MRVKMAMEDMAEQLQVEMYNCTYGKMDGKGQLPTYMLLIQNCGRTS